MADTKQTIHLDLKAQQQLIMTPQLREAISLLQLNNIELAGYLENELAENPFLEKPEPENQSVTDQEQDSPAPEIPDTMDADFDGESGEGFDAGSPWSKVGAGGGTGFDGEDMDMGERIAQTRTLRDHMNEQLVIDTDDPINRMIGSMLIDRLDEAGYLRDGVEDVAAQLGCPLTRVQSVLARLKQFDPAGIFAADLVECLSLQLADRDRLDPAMQMCLKHLDKVAQGDLKALSKLCGVSVEDVQDMIAEIRALNPKPASSFEHTVTQTALPDVLMKRLPKHVGGGWRVELNNETLPRVLVNEEYATIVGHANIKRDDKQYLQDRLASAHWLVRALDQRAQTILKVAAEIIERQDGFFLYGVEFLKPLTLRDIADVVGVHESTVSRVTMGKFIGTPRGLFELKYFFDSGVSAGGGTELAAEAIKAKIKSMVDAESLDRILSDDDLAQKFAADGIVIARRTVAKYREAVGIGSSAERRRQKRNKAGLKN